MKQSNQKYELMAPAGNFACLNAALNAGADSVYFGLGEFNMRASADNFKIKDLPKIKELCDEKKAKAYLALNTIIYDNELKKIEEVIKKAKKYVDGIICWDFAVIELCVKNKIPVHISTQASVSNIESARFFKALGAKSITLARELNLRQIKEISRLIPVCCFAHGALCASVSGRCFTSQLLHNKSANRGECRHPCRKQYNVCDNEGNTLRVENNLIFSAKDLCTLPFIDKMKSSGIKIFKIEGRNRDAEYVSVVVKQYRKALDKKLSAQEINQSIHELKKVYNKGFSSGFFLGVPTPDDFSKAENSHATEKKQFIGKITKYFPKQKVAAVYLNTGRLRLGDEIYVIGKRTGVFRHKIESMEINRKKVSEVSKGQYVGIKMPLCFKNDDVYLIKAAKKD